MKSLLLFFLLSSFAISGQTVKGIVIDKSSNQPIQNVNVYIKSIGKGTTTDNLGKFLINSEKPFSKADTISFSYLGYTTEKYPLFRFSSGSVTVRLTNISEQLDEVNISAERKLKYSLDFKELTSIEKGLHSFGSILVDGKIYIIGGDKSYIENVAIRAADESDVNGGFMKNLRLNPSWEKYDGSVKIYDIEKDTWEYPELEFRERAYHNLDYFEGKLYIHGGKRLSRNRKLEYLEDKVEVFDLKTNSIKVDNSYPHQAINAASFVYDGKLIVLGGSTSVKASGAKVFTNKTHIYNPESGYWHELNNMPLAKEAKGILVEDAIYLFGGFKNNALNAIESLDLISGKWKKVGRLFERMERPGLASDGAVIYIFDDNVFATFNTITNQLNEYHINLRLKSPEMYYHKNKLYIFGGHVPSNYSKLPSPKVFSIDLQELENTKIKKFRKFDF